MAWEQIDESEIVFECDTCNDTLECNVAKVREGCYTVSDDAASDFVVCWQYAQGLGWMGLKRTGHEWTHHCIKCHADAEAAHAEHRKQEHARDRLKARNAS